MSPYFCWGRFIELIKERYPKIIKFKFYFDPRKSVEITKYNQLQLYPDGIVIVDNEKKRALDDLELIEICGCEIDDGDTDDK
jgi:hypothetical protein